MQAITDQNFITSEEIYITSKSINYLNLKLPA